MKQKGAVILIILIIAIIFSYSQTKITGKGFWEDYYGNNYCEDDYDCYDDEICEFNECVPFEDDEEDVTYAHTEEEIEDLEGIDEEYMDEVEDPIEIDYYYCEDDYDCYIDEICEDNYCITWEEYEQLYEEWADWEDFEEQAEEIEEYESSERFGLDEIIFLDELVPGDKVKLDNKIYTIKSMAVDDEFNVLIEFESESGETLNKKYVPITLKEAGIELVDEKEERDIWGLEEYKFIEELGFVLKDNKIYYAGEYLKLKLDGDLILKEVLYGLYNKPVGISDESGIWFFEGIELTESMKDLQEYYKIENGKIILKNGVDDNPKDEIEFMEEQGYSNLETIQKFTNIENLEKEIIKVENKMNSEIDTGKKGEYNDLLLVLKKNFDELSKNINVDVEGVIFINEFATPLKISGKEVYYLDSVVGKLVYSRDSLVINKIEFDLDDVYLDSFDDIKNKRFFLDKSLYKLLEGKDILNYAYRGFNEDVKLVSCEKGLEREDTKKYIGDAKVIYIEGNVEYCKNYEDKTEEHVWEKVEKGLILKQDYVISTGLRGKATLRFENGDLEIGRLTEMKISEFSRKNVNEKKSGLKMKYGSVRVFVKKGTARNEFRVAEPTSVCGVKG